jgi:hypothetical protein
MNIRFDLICIGTELSLPGRQSGPNVLIDSIHCPLIPP